MPDGLFLQAVVAFAVRVAQRFAPFANFCGLSRGTGSAFPFLLFAVIPLALSAVEGNPARVGRSKRPT